MVRLEITTAQKMARQDKKDKLKWVYLSWIWIDIERAGTIVIFFIELRKLKCTSSILHI